MSIAKKDIVRNISSKAHISSITSKLLLNSFLNIIKLHSKTKLVKISNFGSFNTYITPARIGRNPKTNEEFTITARSKLSLNTSQHIKKILN